MRETAFIVIVFIVGFVLQIAWWRMRAASLVSVLTIFCLVYVVLAIVGQSFGLLQLSILDFIRITLLFSTVLLSYTIICSTFQLPSLSLRLIAHIAELSRSGGCPEDALTQFASENILSDRIDLIAESGLVHITGGVCTLTRKGAFYARLFELGAVLFDLPRGG
jgi:hypothetical protein